jgi:CRP/FNR family transcriptional regulator, cyclic AMP receptor protein
VSAAGRGSQAILAEWRFMASEADIDALLNAGVAFLHELAFSSTYCHVATQKFVQSFQERLAMKRKQIAPFRPETFFKQIGSGKTTLTCPKKQVLFSQGDTADAVFYIQAGKVKLSVVSQQGKEAVIAMLEKGSFFGEGCLAGQLVCMASATTMEDSTIVRIERTAMVRVLHNEPAFSEMFLTYLLSRNIRIQEDLVDQLFNSSEKRLARLLLLMAHFGKEGKPEPVVPKISQDTLAEMIGTTRSRVSFFMNKFRKLGFLYYNGGLHVHSSLLNIVLHD